MNNESIQQEQPACELHYLAFRSGFLMTFDCLLNANLVSSTSDSAQCGFLDYVPVMAGTAPQVQLAMLLRTWRRISAGHPDEALDICDRVVVYAATERLAAISLSEDTGPLRQSWAGPRRLMTPRDCWVHSKVRWLQTANPELTSRTGQFMLMDAIVQDRVAEIGLDTDKPSQFDQLLGWVGQWRIDRASLADINDLLTSDEQELLTTFFQEHPTLLS